VIQEDVPVSIAAVEKVIQKRSIPAEALPKS